MPIKAKRKSSVPKKVEALEAARQAVAQFEEEKDLLFQMREEFKEKFPEADEFYQQILRQEDLVNDKVKEAIPLIREAKQDVGEFKCQIKRTTPNYDGDHFLTLVKEIEEGGEIMAELIEMGHVKKLALDPSVAHYFAQHPDAAEHFQPAWRDSQELTPAITPPKF